MKSRITMLLLLCFVVLSTVFFCLWQAEKNNTEDLDLLCQSSALSAKESFLAYQNSGNETDYWYGVAAFHTFEQSYHLLTQKTPASSNALVCSQVYGDLVSQNSKSMGHVDDLVEVMTALANDAQDANGWNLMTNLRNRLQE